MGRILALQVGECLQIGGAHLRNNGFFIDRIDQRHAATLETGTGEPAAIDAVGDGHDLIEGLQFGGACLPIINGGAAAFKGQPAICIQIATTPGFRALLHPVELGIPVLGTLGKVFGQPVFILLIALIIFTIVL